jgi:hypothetical protein
MLGQSIATQMHLTGWQQDSINVLIFKPKQAD